MKNVLPLTLFNILLFLSSFSSGKELAIPINHVESWSCQTIRESADDPTPVQMFQLKREDSGKFSAFGTKNLALNSAEKITSDLECEFVRVMTCDITGLACAGTKPAELGPGEWNNVMFSCRNSLGYIASELNQNITMLNGRAVPQGKTVNILVYPELFSFNNGGNCSTIVK